MSLTARLEQVLHTLGQDSSLPGIKGWRFVVNEMSSITVGIKDNSVGSVYTPPSFRTGEQGELFLIWEDDRISHAQVQNDLEDSLDHWRTKFAEWREAAYFDPDEAQIYPVEPLPLVAVEDRKLYQIIMGEDQVLFDQIKRILAEKPQGVTVNGGVQAAWGYRHIRSSAGLSVSHQESVYSMAYSFDTLISSQFYKRRLIEDEEWDYLWDKAVSSYLALGRDGEDLTAETTVILSPNVVAAMLGQFLVSNFSGQRILDGLSAFKKEHFTNRERRLASGLSIVIDPLKPLEAGSYLVTNEGVPAKRTVLVDRGHLNSPFLGLKAAKRWGSTPTALPHGTAALYLTSEQPLEWQTAQSEIEDGVLIQSVLGLHAQDSVSGDYSLSAPQSLRIVDGRITGKIGVKLSGNFFRDLAAETTRYAFSPYDNKPYMIIKTGVQAL